MILRHACTQASEIKDELARQSTVPDAIMSDQTETDLENEAFLLYRRQSRMMGDPPSSKDGSRCPTGHSLVHDVRAGASLDTERIVW